MFGWHQTKNCNQIANAICRLLHAAKFVIKNHFRGQCRRPALTHFPMRHVGAVMRVSVYQFLPRPCTHHKKKKKSGKTKRKEKRERPRDMDRKCKGIREGRGHKKKKKRERWQQHPARGILRQQQVASARSTLLKDNRLLPVASAVSISSGHAPFSFPTPDTPTFNHDPAAQPSPAQPSAALRLPRKYKAQLSRSGFVDCRICFLFVLLFAFHVCMCVSGRVWFSGCGMGVFTILLAVTFHFVSFNVLRFFFQRTYFVLNCWPIQGSKLAAFSKFTFFAG